MTTRASALFDTLPGTRNKEFQNGVPTPIGLVQPNLYADSHVRLSDLDLDNYQLALVPLESVRPADARGRTSNQGKMLFLPLTLKNLVAGTEMQEVKPPAVEN